MKLKSTFVLLLGFLNISFAQNVELNIKVYLEGPYFNGQMVPLLNTYSQLPFNQPYNISPWNYNGNESVASIPNNYVVDWILVDLLKVYNIDGKYFIRFIDRKAGFILSDGSIKDIDGSSNLIFHTEITGDFYIQIHHRNHLPVISSNHLLDSLGIYHYDFSDGASKALGGNKSQNEVSTGVFAMIAADGDANGQINNLDKNDVWLQQFGLTGYLGGDFDMSSQVNDFDVTSTWNNNAGKGSFVDFEVVSSGFLCGDTVLDFRDGQIYETVQIGNQCWMAENLNIGTMILLSQNQSNNGNIEKYCYNNIEDSCNTFGGLYTWNEIMEYSNNEGFAGICPEGWHIPTNDEWKILEGTVDSLYGIGNTEWDILGYRGFDAGYNLKTESGWQNNGNGSNLYGFNAFPAGLSYNDQSSFGHGDWRTFIWTSTEHDQTNAIRRSLSYHTDQISMQINDKNFGFSLRCIRKISVPPTTPTNPFPSDGSTNVNIDNQLSWDCSDPNEDIITYSIYLGTDPDPTIIESNYNYKIFNLPILDFSTQYFWKIVATDIEGDSTTGPVWDFWTFDTNSFVIPTSIDYGGQVYNLVKIGNQLWFKENLNIGTMISGTLNQTNNDTIEKYCYNNDLVNCDNYGGLYQWNEMMNYSSLEGSLGICPSEWHVPTDFDFFTLENYLDPTIVNPNVTGWRGIDCGDKLNFGGSSGFDAEQGGFRVYYGGGYSFLGNNGYFWTSSSGNWYRRIDDGDPQVYRGSNNNPYGFSARCIRDEPCGSPNKPNVINGNSYPSCNQSNMIYSIYPVYGVDIYNWKIPVDAIIISGQGTTSIILDIGSISGAISVCAGNEYGFSEYTNLNVTIEVPAQPGQITGKINPDCNETGVIFSIDPIPGATSYNWTVPSDAVITAGQGSLAISVDFGIESGNITVNSSNSCGTSDNSILEIQIQSTTPVQPGPIVGNIFPCQLTTKGYSIDPVPNSTTYTWTVPSGAVILNGQGTTSISIEFGTQSGYVAVSAGNGCGISDTTYLEITLQPGVPSLPSPIVGETICCLNGIYTYSINPISGPVSYEWLVPNFIEIISGQGTTSIEVKYNSSGVGNILAFAINDCGYSNESSLGVTGVDSGLPASTSITGLTEIYCGQSGVQYIAAPIPGAFGYYWREIEDEPYSCITITSGQGTNNILVDFCINDPGPLAVHAVDNYGCVSSNYKSIWIQPWDPYNLILDPIVGPTEVLSNQTSVEFSTSLNEGVVEYYNWQIPSGATITSGQGTSTITVDFGIQGGIISVRGESPCGETEWKHSYVKVLHQGGYVFYYDGVNGLIMSPSNTISSSPWGCEGTLITSGNGANGNEIGTGLDNTIAIITDCPTPGIAAQLCYDLVLGGHEDWFLPSRDEFNEIWILNYILNEDYNLYPYNLSGSYWSSTQENEFQAIGYSFSDPGGSEFYNKSSISKVIAIRAF